MTTRNRNNLRVNVHEDAPNWNSVFREEQADLLSPFQHHHYDLLHGNPPSHNPEYVPDGSGSHQQPQMFATNEAAAAAAAAHSSHHSNHNSRPFSPPFVRSSDAASMFDDYYNNCEGSRPMGNTPAAGRATPFGYDHNSCGSIPSAVAVSDTEDDCTTPFASAVRISDDNDTNRQERHRPVQTSMESPRNASMEGHVAPEESSSLGGNVSEVPEWLALGARQPQERERESASGRSKRRNSNSSNSSSFSTGSHRSSWRRLSVQARAAVGETKRSIRKKLSKESKKLVNSTTEMARTQRSLLQEEYNRLERSTTETLHEQQRAATEALKAVRLW